VSNQQGSENMNIRLISVIAALSVLLAVGCSVTTDEGRFDSGKENFIAGNFDQSFKQLQPLAKQGNPEAQYAVGYMYFYGLGTKQNMQEAVEWMQQAADSGQPQAKLALEQLRQDKLVTARAFSENTTQNVGRRSNAQRRSSGGVDRSADVPNQLTATWPQASASSGRPPMPVAPAPEVNGSGDIHSSALLPSAQQEEVVQARVAQTAVSSAVQQQSALLAQAIVAADQPVQKATKVAVTDHSERFAVQLMGAYFPKELEDFSKKLSIPADQYRIVQTKRDGRNWFILTYGDYPSLAAALNARRDLPKELQVLKPWVRNLKQFDQEMIA
jgi:DamX protein